MDSIYGRKVCMKKHYRIRPYSPAWYLEKIGTVALACLATLICCISFT